VRFRMQLMSFKRVLLTAWILLHVSVHAGCGVLREVKHRVFVDQLAFNEPVNEFATHFRDRKLARCAWRDFEQNNAETDYSCHFERGFKQGFIDHIELGATDPPLLPPRKYWKVCYETAEGHEAINDWFGGYRTGITESAETGFRQFITIPVSIPNPMTTLSSNELGALSSPDVNAEPAYPTLPSTATEGIERTVFEEPINKSNSAARINEANWKPRRHKPNTHDSVEPRTGTSNNNYP